MLGAVKAIIKPPAYDHAVYSNIKIPLSTLANACMRILDVCCVSAVRKEWWLLHF